MSAGRVDDFDARGFVDEGASHVLTDANGRCASHAGGRSDLAATGGAHLKRRRVHTPSHGNRVSMVTLCRMETR